MEKRNESAFFQSMVLMNSMIFSSVDKKAFPYTRTQFFIFTVLSMESEVTMKQISRYISSSQEQATRAVAPLVDDGYVERYTHPQNRTHIYIRLTEAGKRFLTAIRASVIENLDAKLDGSLSEEERKDLQTACDTLNRLLLKVRLQ